MMKQHPKTYEDVYSSDRPGSETALNLNAISVGDMDLNDYRLLACKFFNEFYGREFFGFVVVSWLIKKFSYHGRKSISRDRSFVKFLRRHIGKDIQGILYGQVFRKIETYFDEFFPNFEEENPFKNPTYYKFPFKNISMEFLYVVHQLPDRIEMLKYADEKNMSFAKFQDYVLNHIGCENDLLDKPRYIVRMSNVRKAFHIRDIENPLFQRPKKKRR